MDYKQEASEIIIQLGKNLRSERYRLGLSQTALLQITDLERAWLSRFERGELKNIHLWTFLRLNDLLRKLHSHDRESIQKLLDKKIFI